MILTQTVRLKNGKRKTSTVCEYFESVRQLLIFFKKIPPVRQSHFIEKILNSTWLSKWKRLNKWSNMFDARTN